MSSKENAEKKVSRRKFLIAGTGAVVVIGAGAAGYVLAPRPEPQVRTVTRTLQQTTTATEVRTTTAVSTATAITTATVTATPTPSPTRVVNPDNIVIGTRAAIGPFDPVQAGFRWGTNLAYSCYDRLFYHEPGTDAVKPWLVEDTKVSDDKLTHTFRIKSGVRFHNGDQMDAEDVKYSLERALAIPRFTSGPFIAVAKGSTTTVKGSQELELKLQKPAPGLFYPLTTAGLSIINRRQLEAHGGWQPDKDNEWLARNEIGSGPYTLEEYKPDERLTLKRYDGWWAGKPKSPTFVTWIRVVETSTQVAMMKKGEIDFIPLFDTSRVTDLLGVEGIKVIKHGTHPRAFGLYINTSGVFPELANKKVRQALAYAIPYQDIINAARAGWAARTTWFNVEGMAGYLPAEQNPYDTNVTKAKALLTEAGYPNGFKTTLWWSTAAAESRLAATLIQEAFSRVGVTAELRGVTDPVLMAEARKGNAVPMNLSVIAMDTADSSNATHQQLHSSSIAAGINLSQYKDQEMDKLLDQAVSESEFSKVDTLLKQTVKKLLEDVPIIPIYRRVEPLPFREWIDPGPIGWEYVFTYPVWRWKKG